MKPFNKTVRVNPDDLAPKDLTVSNYSDGEWLNLKVEGLLDGETPYLTLSDTPKGADEEFSEGFANLVGQVGERGDAFFYVSPEIINAVSEGGTIYLFLWTSPDGRDWLRAKGNMIRGLAARRDRRLTVGVPDLVIANIGPRTAEQDAVDDLVLSVSVSGGLAPITLQSSRGVFYGNDLHISRAETLDEIVTITAIDSRGFTAVTNFPLTITGGLPDTATPYATFEDGAYITFADGAYLIMET